jgi:hypothetical protein
MRQSRDEKVGFQNPHFTDIYKIENLDEISEKEKNSKENLEDISRKGNNST